MAAQNKGPFIEVPDGRGGVLKLTPREYQLWKLEKNKPITEEDWLRWAKGAGKVMVNDIVLVALIAAVPATLASVLGFVNLRKNERLNGKMQDVDTKVDGRLTELLELTRKSSEAIGVKKEFDREK